jgi:hypothetical protein
MENKKGLYLLLAFIGTIMIFFCILFFVHERTLENGILFTVSFHYENAQDITYNFYNQSGKIEKVEIGDNYKNSFLLEKTEYKSVKLLRKILKGLKEKKEQPTEEGITIYNGQNKRYYLLPYNNDHAKELSNLIIDGYIHSEMERLKIEESKKELYLYEKENGLAWTKNGNTKRIIHTYQCANENCEGIYADQENNEKVLKDGDFFLYNVITKSKEKINTDAEITNVKFLKWQNQIVGLELIKNANEKAFYNLEKKELSTTYQNHDFTLINETLLLENGKEDKNGEMNTSLKVWNYNTKEVLWTKKISDENGLYRIQELKNDKVTYYLLEQTLNAHQSYQILDSKWTSFLEGRIFESVELKEDGILLVKSKKEDQIITEQYDQFGLLVPIA